MKLKAEPCRLYVEQTIDDALAAGRTDDEEIGREMWDFLTDHFDETIKQRSLAQIARRRRAKADLAKREAAAQSERSGPVTTVTKIPYTKGEKDYLKKAAIQAKHDVAFHRNNAGEMGPLPDYDPATLKARGAISILREISPDDPKRLEALNAVAEYLKTQGFELVKPPTSKE